ncbi:MAG: polysaccharide biosynthesis/export family protein [Blastocatellia bacterium]
MKWNCSLIALAMLFAAAISPTVLAQQKRDSLPDRSAVQTHSPEQGSSNVLTDLNKDYQFAVGDVIEVQVEDAPELSREYKLAADGKIVMSVVGLIEARKKTADQLSRLIADRLRAEDYLKSPNVVVALKQFNTRVFFIQGAINQPGVYRLEGRPTLLTMIGLAGGLADNHGSLAYIIRRSIKAGEPKVSADTQQASLDSSQANDGSEEPDAGDYELLKVNLSALYKGKFEQNQMLEPGDIVNVPRADVFFVAGEVQAPGSFPLKEGTTLRQAISLAQGMNFKSRSSRGVIFREDPVSGTRREIKVDIGRVMSGKKEDIPIFANDVVIVPNSRTKSVGGSLLMALGVNTARLPIRY